VQPIFTRIYTAQTLPVLVEALRAALTCYSLTNEVQNIWPEERGAESAPLSYQALEKQT